MKYQVDEPFGWMKCNDIATLSFILFLGEMIRKGGESQRQAYLEVLKRGGVWRYRENHFASKDNSSRAIRPEGGSGARTREGSEVHPKPEPEMV